MLIEWLHRHPRVSDWFLVLLALATTVGGALHHDRRGVGIVLALAGGLALLGRRRRPLPALALTTAVTVAVVAIWGTYNPLPVAIALYTVAAFSDRGVSVGAGAAAIGVLAIPLGSHVGWGHEIHLVSLLVAFAIAWLIGDSVRSRRRYTAALEERAARLERERAAESARAVAEEQARIGRELHDVIGHNVSVMVVQAAAARDVLAARPEQAGEALANIESVGRSALLELRRLLGAVRDETSFAPQPGLDRIDDLLSGVRAAGLDVRLTVDGPRRDLPPALDLSAYRIVQEALTNTLKHAHASHADVLVRYRGGEVELEIRDDGTGPVNGSSDTGRGLIGMRERVAVFGGSLSTGSDPGGGFVVSARFPVEGTLE